MGIIEYYGDRLAAKWALTVFLNRAWGVIGINQTQAAQYPKQDVFDTLDDAYREAERRNVLGEENES